jgi:hypothetical protein
MIRNQTYAEMMRDYSWMMVELWMNTWKAWTEVCNNLKAYSAHCE